MLSGSIRAAYNVHKGVGADGPEDDGFIVSPGIESGNSGASSDSLSVYMVGTILMRVCGRMGRHDVVLGSNQAYLPVLPLEFKEYISCGPWSSYCQRRYVEIHVTQPHRQENVSIARFGVFFSGFVLIWFELLD